MPNPEQEARGQIDADLALAGWVLQDVRAVNLAAARGVAVREFPLERGFGFADYLLYVEGQAVGVIEAKKIGETLTGVEPQAEKYRVGVPAAVPAAARPLPFLYHSTSVETRFTNRFDPERRSRRVFHFHRPATLKDAITALQVLYSRPYRDRPKRADIKALADAIAAPPRAWTPERLWRAYETLEQSKVKGVPERVMTNLVSLVQFALGQEGELRPFPARVEERFQRRLTQQQGIWAARSPRSKAGG